jgi:isopentenyl-diphosphate delta-isomerase
MSVPLVDVVDRDGRALGFSVDVNQATKRGLWFAGVHIVVYTRDGYVLVERRSKTIIFHPNLIDISMGGIIDTGETPEHAAVRELREELGLRITPAQLIPAGTYRYNHRWPTYRKIARNVIYTYLVELPNEHVRLYLQEKEVASAEFISLRRAKWLLRHHRIMRLGRLEPRYGTYRKLLALVEARLKTKPTA